MRLYQKKDYTVIKWAMVLLLSALLLWALVAAAGRTSKSGGEQARAVTENAIRKAAINCYAIEGAYPGEVSYLEENYGVVIDNQKYVVEYNALGSNVLPDIEVIVRGTNAF